MFREFAEWAIANNVLEKFKESQVRSQNAFTLRSFHTVDDTKLLTTVCFAPRMRRTIDERTCKMGMLWLDFASRFANMMMRRTMLHP